VHNAAVANPPAATHIHNREDKEGSAGSFGIAGPDGDSSGADGDADGCADGDSVGGEGGFSAPGTAAGLYSRSPAKTKNPDNRLPVRTILSSQRFPPSAAYGSFL